MAAGDKKSMTKKEVTAFLAEIENQIVDSDQNYLHSMLALNEVLRQPNAHKVLDKGLKEQARDLWLKIKSTGLELEDPPILFPKEQ